MKTLTNFSGPIHLVVIAWLLFSGQLLSWSPYVLVPQVLALALAVWARRSFPPGQFSVLPEPKGPTLIEAGPYRWIRHPMYTASQTIVWSGVLRHASPVNLALGAITVAIVALRVVREEALLREKLPGYTEYALRTKRFVPFVF